ncbi:G-protein coupled receptor 161-like [Dreissena polymorpha]|uniref:G-protein coupled receptor 161-like n=1 Tax=Dreissena polymorpha TaxID=45954 RepID=UPI0022641988|nr:G-protein coupled receptor 161-like [Dreissena polymorpha]
MNIDEYTHVYSAKTMVTVNFTNDVVTDNDDKVYITDAKLSATNLVVLTIIVLVIFVTSLVGNFSVFVIFYKRPMFITISNKFIINLTVCNSLQTLLIMPFVFASMVTQKWLFSFIWCQCSGFLMNAIFAASTLTLVVIAIDRYCAVVKPLHYSLHMTQRRATVMILGVWLIAVMCSIPPLIGWNKYEFQREKIACLPLSSSKSLSDVTYTMVLVCLCFIIPSAIIIWAYCVIFKAARTSNENVRRNSTLANGLNDLPQDIPLQSVRRNSSIQLFIHKLSSAGRTGTVLLRKDERKAAVTSFMILFTFILCWLLYFIIIFLECLLNNPEHIDPIFKTLSVILALSSCAINPLVYVFRGKLQRVQFKSILRFNKPILNSSLA